LGQTVIVNWLENTIDGQAANFSGTKFVVFDGSRKIGVGNGMIFLKLDTNEGWYEVYQLDPYGNYILGKDGNAKSITRRASGRLVLIWVGEPPKRMDQD